MPRPSLVCVYCQQPIVKAKTPAYAEEVLVYGHSQIERAWHRACEPLAIRPDTPWQAATQKLKQAVADARRLSPAGQEAFWEVYDRVKEQR